MVALAVRVAYFTEGPLRQGPNTICKEIDICVSEELYKQLVVFP